MSNAFLTSILLLLPNFLMLAQEPTRNDEYSLEASDYSTSEWQNHGDGTSSEIGRQIISVTDYVVERMSVGKWEDLYAMLSSEVRGAVSRNDYVSTSELFTRQFGRITDHEVLEIFVIDVEKSPEGHERFQTSPIRSKALPSSVIFTIPLTGRIAFVLSRAEVDQIGPTIWLALGIKEERGKWTLFAFDGNPAVLYGKDGIWYRDKADNFSQNGQLRNAYFYRGIAGQLLKISRFVDTVAAREVRGIMSQSVPDNLPAPGLRPAEDWLILENLAVPVHYVGIAILGDGLGLEVRYTTALDNVKSDEADTERQQLHTYVRRNFPEYADAFDGIFIGSVNSAGDGFRDGFRFDNPTKPK